MRKLLIPTFISVFFFLFFQTASAQQAGKQVPITIPSASSPNALLYLPWDYNISGKKYPVILFGHGIQETSVGSLASQGLPGIITHNNPPYALVKGDTVHFIVLSITGQAFLTDQEMDEGLRYLVKKGIRIDLNRVYLTGLSAGARSSVRYISRQKTEGFLPAAATVPMSYTLSVSEVSSGYWAVDFGAFKKKGLWVFTGQYDSHVNVAKLLASSVNKYSPGNGRVTIYPSGHCCWMNYYDPKYRENVNGKRMNIYEWMYQYTANGKSSSPTPNKAPVANAGKDQTITLPANAVTLKGSASDEDGSISSYRWVKTSGPDKYRIDKASSSTTKVTGLAKGTYVFTLTAKDNDGASSSDKVTVTVKAAANKAPVAKAGKDQTITLPANAVTLKGSASDEDGSISSYRWVKTSGPDKYRIKKASSSTTKVTGLAKGTYVFTLTAKDNDGASSSDKVTVTVKAAASKGSVATEVRPIANAGKNQTITLPANSVVLDGSGSKGDIKDWYWTKQSGPSGSHLHQNNGPKATITGLKPGTYVFTLTVSGHVGWPSSDNVTIVVRDGGAKNSKEEKRAIASAGKDQTIMQPQSSVVLDGSGSTGDIRNWYWSKQSGPKGAHIQNSDKAKTTVTGLKPGTYVFSLTVSGDTGWPSSSNVTIIVKRNLSTQASKSQSKVAAPVNKQPQANAGKDQVITLPTNSVTLDGSASTGEIEDWYWSKQSGPSGSHLHQNNGPKAKVTGLKQGTYVFSLTVSGEVGWPSSSKVTVVVKRNKSYSRSAHPEGEENSKTVSDSVDFDEDKTAVQNVDPDMSSKWQQDSLKLLTFKVYPNPVHDRMHIEFSKKNRGRIIFRIVDMNGRILKTYNLGKQPKAFNQTIDVSSLVNGIYLIQLIEDDQLRSVQKIIKL